MYFLERNLKRAVERSGLTLFSTDSLAGFLSAPDPASTGEQEAKYTFTEISRSILQ